MTLDLTTLELAEKESRCAVLGVETVKAVLTELRKGRAAVAELARARTMDAVIAGIAQ